MINAISGVNQPTNGMNDNIKIDKVYTVCQRALRNASLIPRAISFSNWAKLKGKSLPSMIASVFSLK